MNIEILYFDGCPNFDSARAMAADAATQAGVDAQIAMIKVETNADARNKRFVGSPSIRVEGKDVDLVEGADQQYSLRCRVYFSDNGMSGLPSRAKVLGAIEQALGRQKPLNTRG